MKAKQILRLDGWCMLLVAALAVFGLVMGCQQEAVAPHGTVVLEIQTVFADPAPTKPEDDKAEGTSALVTASVDRVMATLVDAASGEVLGEEQLAISGSTASGSMTVEIYGQVNADLRIRMFDGGSLAWSGTSSVALIPGQVLRPQVVMYQAPPSGVMGVVENATNSQPVSGANVELVGTSWSTTTRLTGTFRLEADPGEYTLRITATGFEPAADRQVTVVDTTMTDIGRVTLTPSATPTSGVRGSVQDSQTGGAIAQATVLLVEPSLSVQTGTSGEFELLVDPGTYTLRVSASGYQTSPDQSVTVVADSLTDVGVISLDPGSTTSGVRGRVEHAQEEQPIEGATVQLVEAGLSVETTTSGDFVLYASGGDYTLRVSADGFLPTDRDVTIPAAAVLDVGVIALVPEQAGDEVVIVLTWGDEPADVDAHLFGPSAPPDTSRFHVYWSNRGSRDAPPYAHLDRDVRYGQGPETITITQRLSGTYSYMVHDWSNRSSSPNDPSEELSASGANVRVIMNNQEVRNLIIPSGVPGTLWRVLDIDGTSGDIEIINTLEYSTSPGFTGKPARADKR